MLAFLAVALVAALASLGGSDAGAAAWAGIGSFGTGLRVGAGVVDTAFAGVSAVFGFGFAFGAGLLLLPMRCSSSAPPPTAIRIGHSTKPTAPIAPRVSAAAGVDELPLFSPVEMPSRVPLIPPVTPLIAAPPMLPAVAVMVFAPSSTVWPTPRATERTPIMC